MPVIQRKGAQSSQGFGEFAQSSSTAANYIEDYFSTYLYTGTGAAQTINNGIGLADTAAWSSYKLQQSNSSGYGVTTDSSGNFYVTGYANDGTNTYILIAKYNSAGVIQWQRKLQENASQGKEIAVDSSGNVYVTGVATAGASNYIIIAKYNSSGTIQWQRKLRQNSSEGTGIAIDSSGNVYVIGFANDGSNYIITAKYDSSGVIQWQRKLRQGSSQGYGITTDSSGNIYVTGSAYDGTNFYIIVAKYDSSGTIQWQRKLKQNNSYGYGITTDSSGNVYVTGNAFDGTNDYIITAKYNSSGTIQWQRKLKQNASVGNKISIDSSSNVYVAGQAFDGTNYYIIVVKYNSSGTIQWQRKLLQGDSLGLGITADTSGNIYVTGYAYDSSLYYIVTSKLKQDGTTTSGTAFVTMVPGAATESAGTATDSAGAATDSAGTATDSAGTATDSAGAATSTSATQAAVTGAGGLVWIKSRSGAYNHNLFDTTNGATKLLHSNTTAALTTDTASLTSFNASGFNLGTGSTAGNEVNTSAATFASWTFRKQAKFFDIVTYTGDGVAGKTITHNLGSVPGCIIVKRTNTTSTDGWPVYHRSTTYNLALNKINQQGGVYGAEISSVTSTSFNVSSLADVNANGSTYVAYLFAHNAGGFGSAGTDNVISCGSYAGNNGLQEVNLGYEAQWVLIKNASGAYNWSIYDNMRGMAVGAVNNPVLYPNTTAAEAADRPVYPTSTGFAVNTAANIVNATGNTYIYIAIRRGPMKTPTSGTSVFSPVARTGTGTNVTVSSGFVTDSALTYNRVGTNPIIASRLTSTGYLATNSTASEVTGGATVYQSNPWDVMSGINLGTTSSLTNAGANTFINYFFQRAPGFFDVVCYTGTGAIGQTISHNLTVAPEFIITKNRNGTSNDWYCYQASLASPLNKSPSLNTSSSVGTNSDAWRNITSTSFQIGSGLAGFSNENGSNYIAYLFATIAGVSKVGSYTGTGALQTVNCGFTSGARFVLIKRTDSTGDWYVWDSARGISSANDPYFVINSNSAEVTGTNYVDTDTTGFKVTAAAPAALNASGGSYIFLAVA